MTIEHAWRKFVLKEKVTARMENAARTKMRALGLDDPYSLYYSDDLVNILMPVMLEGNHDGVDWLECDRASVEAVKDYFFGKLKTTNDG